MKLLFARASAEQGRLDVLVNSIWGDNALTEWRPPFWKLYNAQGLELLERVVHSHIITNRHGVPLMVERNAGLVVEVADGDTLGYRGNLLYDLAKNAVIRLAYAMAADLHAHRVTAVALTPRLMWSEAVLDHFGVTEANWRDAIVQAPYFAESKTPGYIGREVMALAADPDVWARSGGLFSSWGLAKEYSFTDMDLSVVRDRLYQIEDDPAAADEAVRLPAYADPYR